MGLIDHYDSGIIDALEKIAAGMTLEQANSFLDQKEKERNQEILLGSASGLSSGIVEGLGDFTPVSGKLLMAPGAMAGYLASKAKNVVDAPKEMYTRNGKLTGRSWGGMAGAGIGAGLGAGAGHLIDSSGLGLGLGSLIGSLVGGGLGTEVGDVATKLNNSDVIRDAEVSRSKKREAQRKLPQHKK